MKFEIVHDVPIEKWESYILEHPKGNIFHTPEMFEVFKQTKNYEPYIFFGVDKETKKIIVLLSSAWVNIGNSLLSKLTSRSIFFGGLVADETEIAEEALTEGLKIHDQIMKGRSLFAEIRNRGDSSNHKSLLERNRYGYVDDLTYIIDLKRNENDIFRSFSSDRRNNIRKAEKKGVIVKEIDSVSQVPIFYDIINTVYRKKKVPLADISLFENCFRFLFKRGMFKIFLAQYGTEWIGGHAVLLFKNHILAWYGGTVEQWSTFHPNEMLWWHVIKWGISSGFHTLDLGGAGKPGKPYGPRDYKARFGGQLVNYGRYLNVYSPALFKLADISYQIYQKYSKRLELFNFHHGLSSQAESLRNT